MKVVFFNCFHNGDIHISREFIRQIIKKVKTIDSSIEFTYTHSNAPNLLNDIEYLVFDPNAMNNVRNAHDNLFTYTDGLYINTWYGQQNYKYMNNYAMTLDCLYAAFDETCRQAWGFSLEDISNDPSFFIPTIDYNKFEIKNAQLWLASNMVKQKIFVANCQAMSGQATNFAMTPMIIELANKYPEKIFILSNEDGTYNLPSNVVYSKNIIRKAGNDLNENSFLTTYCDAIVGRASGVFSYAWTQQNMLKRKFKYITFCGAGVVVIENYKFWTRHLLSDKINYSADFIVSQETDHNAVKSIIDQNI